MRTLYIDGVPGCRVVLDEPALRIVVPERADRLFPLSRISKVVCTGVVDWSMSALLACADAGIHLLFLHKNGEIRGRWLGQCNIRPSLTQRLVDLLAQADGLERYQNWRRAMEKLAVRSLARRLGIVDWREIPANTLRTQVHQALGPNRQYQANVMAAIVQSEVQHWLKDCDFDVNDDVIINQPLDLAEDISKFLMWDCYPTLLDGSDQPDCPVLQAMASCVQAREDRLYLLFRSTVNKLTQFLYSQP